MSIVITIITNITVLVSHNIIYFRYFMLTSHGVNKKAPPVVSPTLFPYQVFTRFAFYFTRNTLSTFFCSEQIIAKNNAFLKSNKFFLSTYCWPVLILLLFVYVSKWTLFHSRAIMKLGIASYLHLCVGSSYFTSHQIM